MNYSRNRIKIHVRMQVGCNFSKIQNQGLLSFNFYHFLYWKLVLKVNWLCFLYHQLFSSSMSSLEPQHFDASALRAPMYHLLPDTAAKLDIMSTQPSPKAFKAKTFKSTTAFTESIFCCIGLCVEYSISCSLLFTHVFLSL